jgi:hypothetical protein
MEEAPPAVNLPPLGSIEPQAGLLTLPPEGQLLYKIMTVENLLRSIAGAYLHFNRVDSYTDGPGADPHDGQQLPADQPGNAGAKFVREPGYSAADYYDQSRTRTYACCFGLENADYLWNAYGQGGAHGKVALVFDFARLRARINQVFATGEARVQLGEIVCHQIFSVNYGVVKYVDRDRHRANDVCLRNSIEYTYLKALQFSAEKELRVTLSAFGMGKFALADGSIMAFPPSLQMQLDFHAAITDGTIRDILCVPETDAVFLQAELHKLSIAPAPGSQPAASSQLT